MNNKFVFSILLVLATLLIVATPSIHAASVYLNDLPSINLNESDPIALPIIYAINNTFYLALTDETTGRINNDTQLHNFIDALNLSISSINLTSNAYVLKTGDTMTGDLHMSNNAINNIKLLRFNFTTPGGVQNGDLYWDAADKTLALKGEDWTLQLGQEVYAHVYNDKAYPLLNGLAVTPDGAFGGVTTVAYANSASQATGIVLGVLTQTIQSGQTGMVTILGVVHDVNTSAYTPGTTLYVDTSGNGILTDIPTAYPGYPMSVGQVITQGDLGSMFIRPRTAETDPIWLSEKSQYYNTTQIDTALNTKAVNGTCPSGSVIQSTYGNGSTPVCQQIPALNPALTNGHIPERENATLINSPWFRQNPTYNLTADEDFLIAYDSVIYIDGTNEVAGVNIPPGTETHEATFSVNTDWNLGLGTLTAGSYNSTNDYTIIDSNTAVSESITWSTRIEDTNTNITYFMNYYQNRTIFGFRGNHPGLTITNWNYKTAPYSDVNGLSTDERGISWSSNGHWKWAAYIPDDSNDTKLCFQSNEFTNSLCLDNVGNVVVSGVLKANGLNLGNSTIHVTGVITDFVNTTEISLNGTDMLTILANYATLANLNLKLNITDQRYNDTALINAVNTTANIESLGFNTTSQLNTLYYSLNNPQGFLNGSGVVNAVGNFTNASSTLARTGNCPSGYSVQNTTTGGVQCIPSNSGSLSGNGTISYIPIWSGNTTLGDSPLRRINTTEDQLIAYNGDLYIDDTNGMVGVNTQEGDGHSHEATLMVQSERQTGVGTITVTNGDAVLTNAQLESFVSGAQIYDGANIYFITQIINTTHASLLQNVNFTSSNWTWQQAPFIDVNGQEDLSRGYSWSQDGVWKWVAVVTSSTLDPNYPNSTQLCFQSVGFNNILCMDNTGLLQVNGVLSTSAAIFPRYVGIMNDTAAVVIDNGNGSITVPSNQVNCYDGNIYTGILRRYTVPSASFTMTLGNDVANYIYVACGPSPTYAVTTDRTQIDNLAKVQVSKVIYANAGSPVHIETEATHGAGMPGRIYQRLLDTDQFGLSQDTVIALGNTGTTISLGGLDIWAGIDQYILPAVSNATRSFFVYHSGGTWTNSNKLGTAFNNTHYDNGTDLVPFTPGYYGIMDIYRGIEVNNHIYFVPHTTQYPNLAQAQAATTVALNPKLVSAHSVFVGRAIFQESNASEIYMNAFTQGTFFPGAGVLSSHNTLSGLDGGSAGLYYHLGLTDYNNVLNKVWNAINTTANIQTLGFATAAQDWANDTGSFYSISNPQAFLNSTGVSALGYAPNSSLANYALNSSLANYYLLSNPQVFLNSTGVAALGYAPNSSLANYYLASNPRGFINGSGIVAAVGNWSADKQYYSNTTTDVAFDIANFYNISNPQGFLNGSGIVSAVGNFTNASATLARTGSCPAGQVVVNTTTAGVQCIVPTVQQYYGSAYDTVNGAALTLTTQSAWYNISGFLIGEGNALVVATSKFTVNVSGLFQISYALTGSLNNNDETQFQIIVNNVAEPRSLSTNRYSNGQSSTVVMVFTDRFALGDNISLQMRDTTRNGAQMTFTNKEFTMSRLST
jgi:hypothetical protein